MIHVTYYTVKFDPPEEDETDWCPDPQPWDTTTDTLTLRECVRTLVDAVEFSQVPITNAEWSWAIVEQDQCAITGVSTEVTMHPTPIKAEAASLATRAAALDARNRARWARAILIAERIRRERRALWKFTRVPLTPEVL